jgi:hypothetical protein
MAITTLDGAIAGMQYPIDWVKVGTPNCVGGRPNSLFYLAGYPGAATAPSPGMAGAALTSYAGQLPFTNPVSGNSYLARFAAKAGDPGITLILCDRLWHNSGITITSTGAQTINSVAFPARDATGTINGVQVYIGVEVSTITGAGAPTFSMTYTNPSDVGSKVGVGTLVGSSASVVGAFYPIGLAAGDVGVKSIQTFTLGASWTSGVIHLVAYRVLARLELPRVYDTNAIDALTSGFPRLYDNTVPFLLVIHTTSSAVTVSGQVLWTQG